MITTGGSMPCKYRHQVRNGNWSEEWELEKTRFKDYSTTQTKTSTTRDKVEKGHARASLTYSRDGLVHFGDSIMLFNDKTAGYLVTDIWTQNLSLEEQYGLFTSERGFPCVRSIFVIHPVIDKKGLQRQDVLCYGSKVRLQANPRSFHKPLLISSQAADPQKSKYNARNQEAFLSAKDNYENVWVVEHIDPLIRFEMNFEPVRANEPLLLKHYQTNQYLASDTQKVKNTYGSENEVFAHSFHTFNKTQNLIAEKVGRTTVDITLRNQNNQNAWVLVTADDPALEFDESSLDRPQTPQDIISKLRFLIVQKGIFSIRGLEILLLEMDQNQSGLLEYDDFRWGLKNFGVQVPIEEANTLMAAFDKDQSGNVNYRDFLTAFKGNLSERRANIINKAYSKVAQLHGKVNLETVGLAYKAHNHPIVVQKQKTAKAHFDEFLKEWDIKNPQQSISQQEFIQYYTVRIKKVEYALIVKHVIGRECANRERRAI